MSAEGEILSDGEGEQRRWQVRARIDKISQCIVGGNGVPG